jgi:hypothetical protein
MEPFAAVSIVACHQFGAPLQSDATLRGAGLVSSACAVILPWSRRHGPPTSGARVLKADLEVGAGLAEPEAGPGWRDGSIR